MRFVKVQYDAYNRQFVMMDRELASQLDDGGVYMVADFSNEDLFSPGDVDAFEIDQWPS
jgi:hypothetical protein